MEVRITDCKPVSATGQVPVDFVAILVRVLGVAGMTQTRDSRLPRYVFRWLIPVAVVAACSSDCVYYPCPLPEAAEIAVTANSSPAGISGLTLAVSGAVVTTAPCSLGSDGTSVCRVMGGPGVYQAKLSAPGYLTTSMTFTVTGAAAGCNTCGHVDRKLFSVVMQPAAG